MYVPGIRKLFAFLTYVVLDVRVESEAARVKIRRDRRRRLRCPGCGGRMTRNYSDWQTVLDLPLGIFRKVLIDYEVVQGRCRGCGKYTTFKPAEMATEHSATWRYMRFVSGLCRHLSLAEVAEIVPIHPSTAMRWDRRVLKEELPQPDLDNLHAILVDEKYLGRAHGYVTLVMNALTGELVHLRDGNKGDALRAFYERLTPEQRRNIQAVGMDRAGEYKRVTEEYLDADIVFDKFHLHKNYNEVVDDVRRKEYNKARAEDREAIKGQRFNLFRNPENRTDDQEEQLAQLFEMNRNLFITDVLHEDFREIFTYRYAGWAEKRLESWIARAKATGIEALVRFANGLTRDKQEILNYFKHRITTGPLEAFNNIVARILHRTCGMGNLGYLFQKLRQESLA